MAISAYCRHVGPAGWCICWLDHCVSASRRDCVGVLTWFDV